MRTCYAVVCDRYPKMLAPMRTYEDAERRKAYFETICSLEHRIIEVEDDLYG